MTFANTYTVQVDGEAREVSRADALKLIYRHTHRDYKGKTDGGVKTILVGGGFGSELWPLDSLTDATVLDRLPYILKKEAARIAAKK